MQAIHHNKGCCLVVTLILFQTQQASTSILQRFPANGAHIASPTASTPEQHA